MKRFNKLRRRISAPPVYLAALCLLLEDWLWRKGEQLTALLATYQWIRTLEARLRRLPPYAALALLPLPALLLLPVKIGALLAIARGHALLGIGAIVLAKIGSAALTARLFLLTRPKLLSLGWFARGHDGFLALKQRWIARLRASAAWRHIDLLAARLRALAWRPAGDGARPLRALIRTLWRAGRR